jgi:glycine/D-amino acid oxidase-like deaminating enzyme
MRSPEVSPTLAVHRVVVDRAAMLTLTPPAASGDPTNPATGRRPEAAERRTRAFRRSSLERAFRFGAVRIVVTRSSRPVCAVCEGWAVRAEVLVTCRSAWRSRRTVLAGRSSFTVRPVQGQRAKSGPLARRAARLHRGYLQPQDSMPGK